MRKADYPGDGTKCWRRSPVLCSHVSRLASFGRAIAKAIPVVSIAVLATSCAGPRASEPSRPTVSVKWRESFRATEHHALPIGGLPGRSIGVMEQRGLAFFERDEVATLALWSTYETTAETNSTYRGYAQYTFKDASTILALLEGSGAVPGAQTGKLTFFRGTGRFLGIEGHATFTAVAVTANDAGGDAYVDAKGEYYLLQTIAAPRRQNQTP
jgi:hypothetical protein